MVKHAHSSLHHKLRCSDSFCFFPKYLPIFGDTDRGHSPVLGMSTKTSLSRPSSLLLLPVSIIPSFRCHHDSTLRCHHHMSYISQTAGTRTDAGLVSTKRLKGKLRPSDPVKRSVSQAGAARAPQNPILAAIRGGNHGSETKQLQIARSRV